MMIKALFIIGFVFLIFLQGSVTTIPLLLGLLLVWYCLTQEKWIFIVAFFSGIFLDVFLVRQIGVSSLFFLVVLYLLFLYQRKFEISSYYFILFADFIATL